jgi:hypothetical protein
MTGFCRLRVAISTGISIASRAPTGVGIKGSCKKV